MNRVWIWLGIAYFVIAGTRGSYLIYAEGWRPTLDEFRAAIPLYAAVGLVGVVLIIRQELRFKQEAKKRRRLDGLLEEAAKMQQLGQCREANRLLDEFRDMFIMLYGTSPENWMKQRGFDQDSSSHLP